MSFSHAVQKLVLLKKLWVSSVRFWVQTHLKRLIWSNNVGFPKGEFLAWRWCRNPNIFMMCCIFGILLACLGCSLLACVVCSFSVCTMCSFLVCLMCSLLACVVCSFSASGSLRFARSLRSLRSLRSQPSTRTRQASWPVRCCGSCPRVHILSCSRSLLFTFPQ